MYKYNHFHHSLPPLSTITLLSAFQLFLSSPAFTNLDISMIKLATLLLVPALALAATIPPSTNVEKRLNTGWCQFTLEHVETCPPVNQPNGKTFVGFYGKIDIRNPVGIKSNTLYLNPNDNRWVTINPDNHIGLTGFNYGDNYAMVDTGLGFLVITIENNNPWGLSFAIGELEWKDTFDDGGKTSAHNTGAKAWCTGAKWNPEPPKNNDLAGAIISGATNEMCKTHSGEEIRVSPYISSC